MKKILFSILIGLVLLVGCSASPVNDIINNIEDDESFVFVLGSSTCTACLTYKPVIKEFTSQKGTKISYVEVDKTDKDSLNKLVMDYLGGDLEFTPTTYVIVEGEVVDTVVGAITYSQLINLFEKHSLIEE